MESAAAGAPACTTTWDALKLLVRAQDLVTHQVSLRRGPDTSVLCKWHAPSSDRLWKLWMG